MQKPAIEPNSRDIALQCMSAIHSVEACVLQLVQKDLGSDNVIKQLQTQVAQLQKDIETLQSRLEKAEKPKRIDPDNLQIKQDPKVIGKSTNQK